MFKRVMAMHILSLKTKPLEYLVVWVAGEKLSTTPSIILEVGVTDRTFPVHNDNGKAPSCRPVHAPYLVTDSSLQAISSRALV